MNEKEQLVKKSLDLSDQEWEGLGEKVRESILKLAEPDKVNLQDSEDKESRHKLAEGVREILALHPDQFDSLPNYQRETILQKINDL